MEKFPDTKYSILGGFLFLRFICPALTVADTVGLVPPELLNPSLRRQLILIGKVLQNLSNGVQFGKKEMHMETMNQFIVNNHGIMEQFLSEMATIPEGVSVEIPLLEESQIPYSYEDIAAILRPELAKALILIREKLDCTSNGHLFDRLLNLLVKKTTLPVITKKAPSLLNMEVPKSARTQSTIIDLRDLEQERERNKNPHKRTDSSGQNVLTKIVQNTAENIAEVKARLKTADTDSPKPLIKSREDRKSDEDNKIKNTEPTSPTRERRAEREFEPKSPERIYRKKKSDSADHERTPFVPTQNIAIQKVRVDLVNLIQPHVPNLAEMIKIEEKLQELIDISAQQAIQYAANSK